MSSVHSDVFEAAEGRVLLKFKAGASGAERDAALKKVGGTIEESFGFDGREHVHKVKLGDGVHADQAAETLSVNGAVDYAEQDYVVHSAVVSNDPGFTGGRMWGMAGDKSSPANQFGTQAAEAWAAGYTGSTKVAVGVIDSGVDYTHPDLYLNVWLNNAEIPLSIKASLVDVDKDGNITFRDLNTSANSAYVRDVNANGRIDGGDLLNDVRWEDGVDTDGNGYRDDLIGWDFHNNDNDPYDDDGHGTHVAGTIAASGGNGVGVAGVGWNTLVVPLKFLDATGSGYTSNAAKAIDYFTAAKSRTTAVDFVATNNSWGGGGYSATVYDAIVRAARADILFVAAAGNGGADGIGDNNNSVVNYPSNYNTSSAVGWDSVIGVAALQSSGALASYSNYGSATVELGAPGSSIYSTLAGGSYGYMSGTSMATPHVTGSIALAAAASGAGALALRNALLDSGLATSSLSAKTMTGDRVDVMSMIQTLGGTTTTPTPPPPPPPPPPTSTVHNIYGTTASNTITGTTGNDKIWGVPATGTTALALGRGTIDVLRGNGGDDIFVLGDSRGRFYDDRYSTTQGLNDYARVTDFSAGDKVQLKGTAGDYLLVPGTIGGYSGMGIFYDANHNHLWDSRDELIGHISGSKTLAASDLFFT